MSVNLAFYVVAKNYGKADVDNNVEMRLKAAILQAIKDSGRSADSVEISGMSEHVVIDPPKAA